MRTSPGHEATAGRADSRFRDCRKPLGLKAASRVAEGRDVYCDRGCRDAEYSARAAEDPGQRLQNRNRDGARAHHQGVAAKLEARGLLTSTAAAESLGISPMWLMWKWRRKGRLGKLVVVNGSVRRVFDEGELRHFEREWAMGGDGRRRSWLNVEHVEARLRARGAVSSVGELDALRERVQRRRRVLLRLARGEPRADARHARWTTLAADVISESPEVPRPEEIYAVVGLIDWQEHVTDWPRSRYPAGAGENDWSGIARRKGIERVRKAIAAAARDLLRAAATPL